MSETIHECEEHSANGKPPFGVNLLAVSVSFIAFAFYAITSDLQGILNKSSSGLTIRGLSAGASRPQSIVDLNAVSLVNGEAFFDLPSPLHAIVTDFPQEQ